MADTTGFFNRRLAKNFLPLPGFQVPKVGELAPDFILPQVGGASVQLSAYRGKQPVVLAFTRIFTEKLFCPFCYPHINDLNDRYADIKAKGAELLMISSTDPVQSERVVTDLSLSYPFLFDPDCEIFRLYGAGQALGAPLPAQFIIDPTGRIWYRHLFTFADTNADPDALLDELSRLNEVTGSDV